jgi:hypothetical protein
MREMIRHLVALKPRILPPLRSSVAVSGTATIIHHHFPIK